MTSDNVNPTHAEPLHSGYRLEVDSSTDQLVGVVISPSTKTTSLQDLTKHITEEGYGDFYFPANSKEQFLRKLQKMEIGRFNLGERRNAKIKISIAGDKSYARVQTSAAFGGSPLTLAMIQFEIKSAKLDSRCIDKNKLAHLTQSTTDVDLILARAIAAVNGVDAQLTHLVESTEVTYKDSNKSGAIDQRELFEFVVVEPMHSLMKKTPATQGQDGLDVTGKAIKAKPGADIAFLQPFIGVEIAPSDENLLVSSIKGHPVLSNNAVRVDPVMALKAVDIHSGNVNYDGSIVVAGDIESGYSVNVSGDVLVKGAIYQSRVTAGGAITVNGGVHADNVDSEHGCHLNAEGDIRAKFIHHSNVHSQGNIHIAEYIMQSRVTAKGEIKAGQERGKGCIIGGYCYSDKGVSAKVLGSDAYVTTCISLGSNDEVQLAIQSLMKTIKRRRHEEQQLCLILKKIRSQAAPTKTGQLTLDKARKIENTVAMLHQKIADLNGQLTALKRKGTLSDLLQVSVQGNVYPNVVVSIYGRSWSCESVRSRVVIRRDDETVIVEPLK